MSSNSFPYLSKNLFTLFSLLLLSHTSFIYTKWSLGCLPNSILWGFEKIFLKQLPWMSFITCLSSRVTISFLFTIGIWSWKGLCFDSISVEISGFNQVLSNTCFISFRLLSFISNCFGISSSVILNQLWKGSSNPSKTPETSYSWNGNFLFSIYKLIPSWIKPELFSEFRALEWLEKELSSLFIKMAWQLSRNPFEPLSLVEHLSK